MQVTLANTSGALQIAISISVFLFGIVTMQTHRYYHTFQDDRLIFKFLVALLWVLEFGQSIAVSYQVYKQTTSIVIVTRFAGLGTALLLGGLITTLVQTFFALRVFKLLPKPFSYIGIFCAMLATCRCIGSFVLGHAAILTHNVIVWRTQWKWLITTLFVSGAFIDVVIAVSMVLFLVEKRQEALSGGALVIDQLVGYSIRTGFLTSITALVVLICYMTMIETYIWMAAYTVLAKLYSNSFLSALNGRLELRESVNASRSGINSISKSSRRKALDMRPHKKNQNHTISIGVKSEIEMYSEAIENTNELKEFWDMTPPPQNPASAYTLPTKMV